MNDYEWVEITKQEFDEFVKSYPNQISRDFCQISEPPVDFFFDWSLAPEGKGDRWDKCVIARAIIQDYKTREFKYWLVKRSSKND